jgi:hypothetical protein
MQEDPSSRRIFGLLCTIYTLALIATVITAVIEIITTINVKKYIDLSTCIYIHITLETMVHLSIICLEQIDRVQICNRTCLHYTNVLQESALLQADGRSKNALFEMAV